MTRRQFAFWVGMFLFWFGEKVRGSVMDAIAAAMMRLSESAKAPGTRERWKPDENTKWRWYERESLVDGEWQSTGITRPVDRVTGERYTGKERGYLNESLVPTSVKLATNELRKKLALGKPDAERRAADGRPPSKWLRSLNADEIRLWLKTIEVPEAGVDGMTFWTHLTRDHSFSAERIRGLKLDEQAKLHAAAHFGY